MRTLLVAALWLGAAAAQSDHVAALREHDWRVRNETAVILAALPDGEFDVDALIDVLRAPWDGPEIRPGRYGGRGGRPPGDPLTRVLTSAADVVAGRKIVGGVSGQKLTGTDQLVVPWHPHKLAEFLLRARPTMLPRVSAALSDVPLTTPELAAVWLAAATPDFDALQRRAEDGSDLVELAQQLWSDEVHRRSLLPALVAEGASAWRSAVLDLGDAVVLSTPEAQRAAVVQFLTGEGPSARKQAGFVLTQLGAEAVPRVLPELREPEHAAAGLALLCTLGERAEGVGEELLPFLTGRSREEKQRALAVIARAPIAAASRPALAEAAFAILQEGPTLSMRILAIDALANLGDGVNSSMREELLRCVDEPSGDGKRARVLGCLWRLKVPVDLAPERKVRICTMVFASDDTWLAAADEGASAMPDLAKLLSADEHLRRQGLVGERLAQVAPRELATWLDHADAGIRSLAIRCLRTCDPEVVPTARIVPLLADAKTWVARAALEWIADRADVAAHRETVLAAVAAVDDRWAMDFVPTLFARLGLTTADRLTVLADKLRQGLLWELVRDGEAVVLREALLRWYRETTEPAERAGLVAELVRLGLRDDEIALVREALRGPNASRLGSALREAESLPASLRGDLAAVLDRALASKDWDLAWLANDVRTALLAHYRR